MTKSKNKQIGYMPTTIEGEQIDFIAKVFGLTRTNVIRTLMYSSSTLEDFHNTAKQKLQDMNQPGATEQITLKTNKDEK